MAEEYEDEWEEDEENDSESDNEDYWLTDEADSSNDDFDKSNEEDWDRDSYGWGQKGKDIEDDVDELKKRAKGIERKNPSREISFGSKYCNTRHGCTGATNCDSGYGNYPG